MSQNQRFTSNSADSQRFAKTTPSPPPTPPPPIPPPSENYNPNPSVQSLLPQLPDTSLSDLSIFIDSSGKKKLVNSKGEESLIRPFFDKFFGLNSQQKDSQVFTKKAYKDKYKIQPNSKIYNYNPQEIHLLSQFYEPMFDQAEKEDLTKQYKSLNFSSKASALFLGMSTIYFIVARKMTWHKLVGKNVLKLGVYMLGVPLWIVTQLDLAAFEVTSILEHRKSYERMIDAYESDHQIVY